MRFWFCNCVCVCVCVCERERERERGERELYEVEGLRRRWVEGYGWRRKYNVWHGTMYLGYGNDCA